MFIKSTCNDCIVNSDQIVYMDIKDNYRFIGHEDSEYKYHLVAHLTSEDDVVLVGTDDMEFAKKRAASILDRINDLINRVYVVDGHISNYPCE